MGEEITNRASRISILESVTNTKNIKRSLTWAGAFSMKNGCLRMYYPNNTWTLVNTHKNDFYRLLGRRCLLEQKFCFLPPLSFTVIKASNMTGISRGRDDNSFWLRSRAFTLGKICSSIMIMYSACSQLRSFADERTDSDSPANQIMPSAE